MSPVAGRIANTNVELNKPDSEGYISATYAHPPIESHSLILLFYVCILFSATFFSPTSTGMQGVFNMLFGSGTFYLASLLLITLCVLPDLVARAYHDLTNPIFRYIARDKASRKHATPSRHVSRSPVDDRPLSACWDNFKIPNKVAVEDDRVELEILSGDHRI